MKEGSNNISSQLSSNIFFIWKSNKYFFGLKKNKKWSIYIYFQIQKIFLKQKKFVDICFSNKKNICPRKKKLVDFCSSEISKLCSLFFKKKKCHQQKSKKKNVIFFNADILKNQYFTTTSKLCFVANIHSIETKLICMNNYRIKRIVSTCLNIRTINI